MNPELAWLIGIVAVVIIVAVAAVLVARFALSGTQSKHRAAVLSGVAEVVRAIRGKR
ncbi:hypothetical protein ACFRCW_39990 [Streptomyces sp. NPDC056653]|uniref:hypothetical protein n=1 Tax=Streptomyces sp. NPDC056653 TaxID=3345894 RepID=UPI0036AEC2E5